MLLPPSVKCQSRLGFTLVELLVVMAVILALLALLQPAISSIKGAKDTDRAAADITSMFQICRGYAVTNNTYVYLGIGEFDSSVPESDVQQAAGGNTGGRVAMIALASRDGSRHYSPYCVTVADIQSGWTDTTSGYNNGANFKAITKLQHYENLHLFSYGYSGSSTTPPPSGPMARPAISEEYYLLGDAMSDSATPITFPLGASPRYTFKKVIQFDPEGLARIAPANVGPSTPFSAQGVSQWMEVGLIASRGNVIPNTTQMFPSGASQNVGNHVCLQIDGMKASVRTFRPGL